MAPEFLGWVEIRVESVYQLSWWICSGAVVARSISLLTKLDRRASCQLHQIVQSVEIGAGPIYVYQLRSEQYRVRLISRIVNFAFFISFSPSHLSFTFCCFNNFFLLIFFFLSSLLFSLFLPL